MPSPLQSMLNNGFYSQFSFKRPEMESAFGFNPDSSYGANRVPRSNLINADPIRDIKNAAYGSQGNLGQFAQNPMTPGANPPTGFNPVSEDAFGKLMAGTDAVAPDYASDVIGQPFSGSTTETGIFDSLLSDKAQKALQQGAESGLMAMIPAAGDVIGQRITGSRLGGKLAGTAATAGLAASQGFANPMTDAALLMKALQTLGVF